MKANAMGDLVECVQGSALAGEIGRTIAESSPPWPRPLRGPADDLAAGRLRRA